MSDADIYRLARAAVDKARRLPRAGFTDDEWLATVIGTTVADAVLVAEGTLDVADLEMRE